MHVYEVHYSKGCIFMVRCESIAMLVKYLASQNIEPESIIRVGYNVEFIDLMKPIPSAAEVEKAGGK